MDKVYSPKSFEDKLYKEWEDSGYFYAGVDGKKKPFTIVMPPPNITGQLHMGHALNDTLQDILIRHKRMQGYSALWLPGTDHASIATEVKIVEQMAQEGLTKEGLGREGFLRRAWEWKNTYGGKIVHQIRKLGCSCDWSKEAFTMDERCSRAVTDVFVKLYDKGLIYRGDRIINWCPDCLTALSDAEVEHELNNSYLWHIKYPADNGKYIIVATTRPETMLGDTAVAVHPDDKRYKDLAGKFVELPLTGRKIPVITDGYVDPKFGTGAVKITPAHDPNDFEVGKRHDLPVMRVMNDNGTMNNLAGEQFDGLDRFEARKKIVAMLKAQGLLVKTEPHKNNVGHCYRCDSVVEPIVSKQWFVKMDGLVKPAIAAAEQGKLKFTPARFAKTYLHWLHNIRDWCISRQLWWGHRIPAYYCNECPHTVISAQPVTECGKCGGTVRQDEDVLDTWFSSALWPFSTLGYPQKTAELDYFYPTDVLVTGNDIIFFWVARMVFSGYEFMGEKPFSDVLINGIVRDSQGRKMSKSLGNGIDPVELIDKYGADALRFSLLFGGSVGKDIRFSVDKVEADRTFLNKLWNAARFVLSNKENIAVKGLDEVTLAAEDKWILHRFNLTVRRVNKDLEVYNINRALTAAYDFVWSDYCDWYIEMCKVRLYGSDNAAKESAMSLLVFLLDGILKLLHPFVPFVTDKIYTHLMPGQGTIMLKEYPKYNKAHSFAAAHSDFNKIIVLIKSIRELRRGLGVPQNKRTAITFKPLTKPKLVKACLPIIEKLAMGDGVSIVTGKPEGAVEAVSDICYAYILKSDLIDTAKERERLTAELNTAKSELKRAEGKLKNQGFVQKAPPALINAEKEKAAKYLELVKKLEQSISELA